MHIDSVRELKQQLTIDLLAPLVEATVARRSLHVAAQPMARAVGLHRTISLGVTPSGKQEYRLAVRVQRRAMEDSAQLEAIRKRAKGECDANPIRAVLEAANVDLLH